MAKKRPAAYDTPLGDAFGPAMDRFRAIASSSCERLYLSDGPPHPDWQLLDLCADALHFATSAEKAMASRDHSIDDNSERWSAEGRARDAALLAQYWDNTRETTNRIRRAQKMKATTPAGIYAKALLVRVSKTGAAGMAMSLAVDLLDCPGLRESLWPAPEGISA